MLLELWDRWGEERREQVQVTDHIPKSETFFTGTAGKCNGGLNRQDGGSLNQWDVYYLPVGDPGLVLTRIKETLERCQPHHQVLKYASVK